MLDKNKNKNELRESKEDSVLDLNELENVTGGNMQSETVKNDTTKVSPDTLNNV